METRKLDTSRGQLGSSHIPREDLEPQPQNVMGAALSVAEASSAGCTLASAALAAAMVTGPAALGARGAVVAAAARTDDGGSEALPIPRAAELEDGGPEAAGAGDNAAAAAEARTLSRASLCVSGGPVLATAMIAQCSATRAGRASRTFFIGAVGERGIPAPRASAGTTFERGQMQAGLPSPKQVQGSMPARGAGADGRAQEQKSASWRHTQYPVGISDALITAQRASSAS